MEENLVFFLNVLNSVSKETGQQVFAPNPIITCALRSLLPVVYALFSSPTSLWIGPFKGLNFPYPPYVYLSSPQPAVCGPELSLPALYAL